MGKEDWPLVNQMELNLPVTDTFAPTMNTIMKYILTSLVIIAAGLILAGCNHPSPETYFDLTVLNTNVLVGFADNGMERELESPSLQMVKNTEAPVPMKRMEIINSKIEFAETNLARIEKLGASGDTKEMITASRNLWQFIISVYKNEYTQLAKLYDTNADKDQITSLLATIHEKYYSKYDELTKTLIAHGKIYAADHKIKVNWGL